MIFANSLSFLLSVALDDIESMICQKLKQCIYGANLTNLEVKLPNSTFDSMGFWGFGVLGFRV